MLSVTTAGHRQRGCLLPRLLVTGIFLSVTCLGNVSAEEVLALAGARMIDGNGGAPVENSVIIVRGQTISDIGPSVPIPANAHSIDLTGKTVLPGLIDTHVHIGGSGGGSVDPREFTPAAVENSLLSYLKFGVTTIYDMAALPELEALKSALAAGELVGPRLYGNGFGITAPGSHPMRLITELGLLDYLGPFYFQVDDAIQARDAVDRVSAARADGVKIFHSRAESGTTRYDADREKLKPDVLRALVEQAHERGLQTYAHISFPSEAKEFAEAGGDVIVHSIHMAETSAGDVLALMAARNMAYIPTLAVFEGNYTLEPEPYLSIQLRDKVWDVVRNSITAPGSVALAYQQVPGLVNDRKRSLDISMANLDSALTAGVTVAMGSDAGNAGMPHGATVLRELQLMHQAGMTPMQVLTAATRNGATVIGQEQRLGTLEVGKLADLIVVDGDPLADLSALGNVELVVLNGKIIYPNKLEFKRATAPVPGA